jgi:hypothetical protein
MIVILVLFGVVGWSMVPPFPSPDTLAASSRSAMENHYGVPTAGRAIGATSAAWETSRGIAVWSVRASWTTHPLGIPNVVWRCVRLRWTPDQASLCQMTALLN